MLPHEVSSDVARDYPCREGQIQLLATLLQPNFPTPSNLVCHGLPATGKTVVARSVLQKLGCLHTYIDTRLCITGRQLLEDVFAGVAESMQGHLDDGDLEASKAKQEVPGYLQNDSLSSLHVNLERTLSNVTRFVLVLDAIDRQRDAPATMLPALARFGESIPQLTIVYIISVPSPRLFHLDGVPHVHFPQYSRDEILEIVSSRPPESNDVGPFANDLAWIWHRYCAAVWDSIGKDAARDLLSFTQACRQLWTPFIQPVLHGEIRNRDFSKLLVSRRQLLQGEDAVLDEYTRQKENEVKKIGSLAKGIPKSIENLPYHTKHLIIAAYLASYNPSRLDPLCFMKSTERKKKRRGITNGSTPNAKAKTRKIPRNLLAPSPFSLDRLLAIANALLPSPMGTGFGFLSDIATLCSLRLLLRTAGGSSDALDPTAKYKVNVGWDFVSQCGRSVSLDVRDYAAWIAG